MRSSFDVLADLFAQDVDRSLLARSLARTPTERIAWLEETQEFAEAARRAADEAATSRRDARTGIAERVQHGIVEARSAWRATLVGMPVPTASEREQAFRAGIEHAGRFFMGSSNVHHAMTKLVAALDGAGISYAIAGAMALNEYGYRRVTTDIDVLLTPEGLAAFKAAVLGLGYVEKFPGSKGLRDTENNVAIDVLLTGEYPGDGTPKPVRFPDPTIAVRGPHGAFLPLPVLVELKLASGLSAPHRLKDLADVLELIRATGVERAMADALDPSVRSKFLELWDAAQIVDDE